MLVCGTPIAEDDRQGILIHEWAAWRLGFRTDADLQRLLGSRVTLRFSRQATAKQPIGPQTLRTVDDLARSAASHDLRLSVVLRKLINSLDHTPLTTQEKDFLKGLFSAGPTPSPTGTHAEKDDIWSQTFIVRSVHWSNSNQNTIQHFLNSFQERDSDVLAHRDVVGELFRRQTRKDYFPAMVLDADSPRHVEPILERVKAMSLHAYSPLEALQPVLDAFEQNGLIVYAIAACVLMATAIGIFNTLAASVIERTPEFGIMKSQGATDRDILLLMLT